MKLAFRILLPAILIGAGVWLWIYFNPPPDEAIRRQLARLSRAASFEGREGLIAQAAASQEVASFFAPEVTMNIEPRGIFEEQITRAEIAMKVGLLRQHPELLSFKVTIIDPVITLGADRKSAIVDLTINAAADGERHLIVQEMKFTMREIDDQWLIYRVDTVRTLNELRGLPALEQIPSA